MDRRPVLGASAVLLIVACAVVGGTFVQARQPSNPDVLPALLAEVKGLRAAMEQIDRKSVV